MNYSKKIIDHFKNPRNYGKIKKPSAVGQVGNKVCGDVMKIYLKIENDIIKDIKFETLGCLVAIANTSLLTTLVKGKTIKQALKIKKEDLVKKFGKIPSIKIHCSFLAVEALKKAIENYYEKSTNSHVRRNR
ncbi:MAG: iron-sulfur cluster assembly scaffold protein [Candidatus Pacebacteria bacterium]|nr:iron-sulfur cluster assembly scaffold protein [Candidatus Paceibacterota bacterium]